MQPTSQPFAADAVTQRPAPRRLPPARLYPELLRAAIWKFFAGTRIWYRGTWLYRRFWTGPLADRVLFHPYAALPRRLEDADALLRGRFRLAGQILEATNGSIFDAVPPSAEWARALHSFSWLPPLALAGGGPAKKLAPHHLTKMGEGQSRDSPPCWSPADFGWRHGDTFSTSCK